MSYTEIYKFKKNGNAELLGEIHNAWRGAMAIWNILDKKYLPPYKPEWAKMLNEPDKYYYRMSGMDENERKKVWNIFYDEKITIVDKIVMGSTFDNVIVKREDFERLIDAFEEFEGETSLKEQAVMIKEAIKDKNIIAIGWNQTSVNGDTWANYNYNEKTGNYKPYNILKQDKHWSLFDEIPQTANAEAGGQNY